MSKKTWQRVTPETFNAHLDLFEDVRSGYFDESTNLIYYTVNDTGQQWVGKVTEDGHYIALT